MSLLYTLYGFALLVFVFWCGLWLLHVAAILHGKYKLHKKLNLLPSEIPYPGVTILKPLMGVDTNLSGNLETFFLLNYPTYEILFCMQEETDPSVMLVRRLMDKYPHVDSRIFLGGADVGVNPKINNMQPGYEAAKHPLILISDSRIKMKDDTLMDMVSYMADNVGLVHQMPFTSDQEGFASTLEKIYFGTFQARIYLVSDFIGINCHTGMSALMRKSLIDEVGGLQTFACYLAEDFFFAKSIMDRGWRICVSSQPALQNAGNCEVSSFQTRLQRWTKLRVAMLPHTIILEPLSECMVIGACAALAVNFLFYWDALVFYLVHILIWFFLDWILLSVVQNGPLPFNKFEYIVGWLFRELTGPYLFVLALWDPAIKWHARTFKLRWGGHVEELEPYSDNCLLKTSEV